jgi:hypothetical protein
MMDTNDMVYVLMQNKKQTENKLAAHLTTLVTKVLPRLVDGKIVMVPGEGFEEALEEEQRLRKLVQSLESKLLRVEALLDEAHSITPLPERTLSGINQAANFFSNKVVMAEQSARIELEQCLSRGLPIEEPVKTLLAIQQRSDEGIKDMLAKAEKLNILANQVRSVCLT